MLRGKNHKFLLIFLLFLNFFAYAAEAHNKRCLASLLDLPPLPALKDVDLHQVMPFNSEIRDSVVAAIAHEGKILMLQRGGEIGHGSWGLVGGKLDPGESIAVALGWEVWEEVGLENLTNLSLINVHYHVVENPRRVFRVFVVKADFDPIETPEIKEPDKILDMGWYPLSELPQPIFANFDIYKNLLNEISGDKN